MAWKLFGRIAPCTFGTGSIYLSWFALTELDDLGGLDLAINLHVNVSRRPRHDNSGLVLHNLSLAVDQDGQCAPAENSYSWCAEAQLDTHVHLPLSDSLTFAILIPHSLLVSSPWYVRRPPSYGRSLVMMKDWPAGSSNRQNWMSAEDVEQLSLASSPALTSTLCRPDTDTSHWAETQKLLHWPDRHVETPDKVNQSNTLKFQPRHLITLSLFDNFDWSLPVVGGGWHDCYPSNSISQSARVSYAGLSFRWNLSSDRKSSQKIIAPDEKLASQRAHM